MPPFELIFLLGQTLCHGIDERSADLSMRLCFRVESQRAAEDVYVEKMGQLRENLVGKRTVFRAARVGYLRIVVTVTARRSNVQGSIVQGHNQSWELRRLTICKTPIESHARI